MTRTLPTYRSVCAQMSSWPHGFSTRRVAPSSFMRRLSADQPLAGSQQGVPGVGRGRLGVDADERLGARRPDEQPRAVAEEELETVAGVERHGPGDRLARELGRRRGREVDQQSLLRL